MSFLSKIKIHQKNFKLNEGGPSSQNATPIDYFAGVKGLSAPIISEQVINTENQPKLEVPTNTSEKQEDENFDDLNARIDEMLAEINLAENRNLEPKNEAIEIAKENGFRKLGKKLWTGLGKFITGNGKSVANQVKDGAKLAGKIIAGGAVAGGIAVAAPGAISLAGLSTAMMGASGSIGTFGSLGLASAGLVGAQTASLAVGTAVTGSGLIGAAYITDQKSREKVNGVATNLATGTSDFVKNKINNWKSEQLNNKIQKNLVDFETLKKSLPAEIEQINTEIQAVYKNENLENPQTQAENQAKMDSLLEQLYNLNQQHQAFISTIQAQTEELLKIPVSEKSNQKKDQLLEVLKTNLFNVSTDSPEEIEYIGYSDISFFVIEPPQRQNIRNLLKYWSEKTGKTPENKNVVVDDSQEITEKIDQTTTQIETTALDQPDEEIHSEVGPSEETTLKSPLESGAGEGSVETVTQNQPDEVIQSSEVQTPNPKFEKNGVIKLINIREEIQKLTKSESGEENLPKIGENIWATLPKTFQDLAKDLSENSPSDTEFKTRFPDLDNDEKAIQGANVIFALENLEKLSKDAVNKAQTDINSKLPADETPNKDIISKSFAKALNSSQNPLLRNFVFDQMMKYAQAKDPNNSAGLIRVLSGIKNKMEAFDKYSDVQKQYLGKIVQEILQGKVMAEL